MKRFKLTAIQVESFVVLPKLDRIRGGDDISIPDTFTNIGGCTVFDPKVTSAIPGLSGKVLSKINRSRKFAITQIFLSSYDHQYEF